MKKIILPLILQIALLTEIATAATLKENEETLFTLGQTREFPVSSNIWIENGKVLKAKVKNQKILLTSVGFGRSLFRMGNKLMVAEVIDNGAYQRLQDLKQAAQKTISAKLRISNGDIKIEGKIYSILEYLSLREAAHGAPFVMRTSLNKELQQTIQKLINDELENQNLPPQLVLFNHDWQIRLPKSHPQLAKYREVLQDHGIKILVDDSSLETKPLINIQITIAEMRKDRIRKMGLRWPSQYTASLLPNGSWQQSEALFSAEAFEAEGLGKILASPRLLSRSGSEASFNAGGEIPIKILNYKHQSIDWKPYGVQLKILPIADSSGRMSIRIETEISSIDESRKVDDIPAFLHNKVQSQFDLLEPKTIVLSGLIKQEGARQVEGLPGLSQIPVLGRLFSSKDFQDNKTELVILVRPEIVKAEEVSSNSTPYSHLGDQQ